MNEALKPSIKAHALTDFPREACGLVIEEDGVEIIQPTPNLAEKPTDWFSISPELYLTAFRSGKLRAYYHSHPKNDERFSEADKAVAEKLKLPLYVYSVVTDVLALYTPNGYVAPLEGRNFELGTHDCAGLVLDYFQQRLKITLSNLSRTGRFVADGIPNILDYCRENNLKLVSGPPKKHDIVLMRIGRSKMHCNHAGVMLDEKVMLHQLMNQRSGKAVYGGYWAGATRHILRHQTLL